MTGDNILSSINTHTYLHTYTHSHTCTYTRTDTHTDLPDSLLAFSGGKKENELPFKASKMEEATYLKYFSC